MADDAQKQKLTALTRLALATREKVDRETFVLYLEAVQAFSPALVTEACRRLEDAMKWFPKKAELLEECGRVAMRDRERREDRERKRLPPAPLSPERHAEIMARFRDVLRSKAMR
jgi:hypothetical protein